METIGKAALTVITGGMGSSTPVARPQTGKPVIRQPETMEEARALKAWAESIDDRPTPATPMQITKHLTFLAATLPSRAQDDDTGKMRFAVYSSILSEFSNDALAFMARKACERLDWFPTPKQCLDILRDYPQPGSEKERALALCHRFWQGKFEDWIALIASGDATQGHVDSVNSRWQAIAMEQGYLRWIPERQAFVIRRKVLSA
jgi:hypothetical protein